MTGPIEIKLPNGLIIAMMPHVPQRGMSLKAPTGGETDDQLWHRFIAALTTTDWVSLGKVYSTAMPVPPKRNDVSPSRPQVVHTPMAEAPKK